MSNQPQRPHRTTQELLEQYVNLLGPRGEDTPQSRLLLAAYDDKVFRAMAVNARELKAMFARSYGRFRGIY